MKRVDSTTSWSDAYPRQYNTYYHDSLSEGQNQFSWAFGTNENKLVDAGVGIDNSGSRFTIISPVFAAPFCPKGRYIFSNIYEMVPGLKNLEIEFTPPDGKKLAKDIMFRDDTRQRFIAWGGGGGTIQQMYI